MEQWYDVEPSITSLWERLTPWVHDLAIDTAASFALAVQ